MQQRAYRAQQLRLLLHQHFVVGDGLDQALDDGLLREGVQLLEPRQRRAQLLLPNPAAGSTAAAASATPSRCLPRRPFRARALVLRPDLREDAKAGNLALPRPRVSPYRVAPSRRAHRSTASRATLARQNSNTSMRASAWMRSVASCASALRWARFERRSAGKDRCRAGKRNMGSRACAMGMTRWITARLAALADFDEHRKLPITNRRIAADEKSDDQRLRPARGLRELAHGRRQRQTNRLRMIDVRRIRPPNLRRKPRARPAQHRPGARRPRNLADASQATAGELTRAHARPHRPPHPHPPTHRRAPAAPPTAAPAPSACPHPACAANSAGDGSCPARPPRAPAPADRNADPARGCARESADASRTRATAPRAKNICAACSASAATSAEPSGERGDFHQRALEALRIARELHPGRIGKPLALPRHRRLQNAPRQQPHVTQHHDREPHATRRRWSRGGCAARPAQSSGRSTRSRTARTSTP